jgi:hypothetical protein
MAEQSVTQSASANEDLGDTASSPGKAPSSAARDNGKLPRIWSKDDAMKLLRLLLNSLFFVLPKAGLEEVGQLPTEACKKAVILNLIERVLVGVDLTIYKAGGNWGKALNSAIKTRRGLQTHTAVEGEISKAAENEYFVLAKEAAAGIIGHVLWLDGFNAFVFGNPLRGSTNFWIGEELV